MVCFPSKNNEKTDMKKYLFGAKVQGIQSFIFETNKLQEIAGASEIIEQVSNNLLAELLGEAYEGEKVLMAAAGSIRYLFDDKGQCEQLVYQLPRALHQKGAGLSVSQAVIEIEGELQWEHFQKLDRRLSQQRNRPTARLDLGWMVSERSRRTGRPATERSKATGYLDGDQSQKRKFGRSAQTSLTNKLLEAGEQDQFSFPTEFTDITTDGWLAVVHADGNDLGKRLMAMKGGKTKVAEFSRELSKKLEKATLEAARLALKPILDAEGQLLPLRPILLGGDDLTLVIRGDLALSFTRDFLFHFEQCSRRLFADFSIPDFQKGFTACAGIAYIKPKYPFHYGVSLAEELCKHAKKVSRSLGTDKGLTPSSLMFHKVQASYVKDYEGIQQQELQVGSRLRLDYGPYFLEPPVSDYASLHELGRWLRIIGEPEAPRSRLRAWLTELALDTEAAKDLMRRIRQVTPQRYLNRLPMTEGQLWRERSADQLASYTPLFDILSLSGI
jgi:hypothetical protein